METIETIKLALQKAAKEGKKDTAFHGLVLLHADELEDYGAKEFCRDVGARETFKIEFRKMIAAARMLSELGYSIQKKK